MKQLNNRLAAVFTISLLTAIGCSDKTKLTSNEQTYVKTTLSLIRAKSQIVPGMDAMQIDHVLDSVYRINATDSGHYVALTKDISDDPERSQMVYTAIKDSLGPAGKPAPRSTP